MAAWTVVLDDQAGSGLQEIRAAFTVEYVRNRHGQIAYTLDLEDEAARSTIETLRDGLPRLRAYRDGELRLHGRWAPTEEEHVEGDQDTSTMRCVFRGPLAALERRFTAATVPFAAVDAGAIAASLITTANTAAPTGIVPGTIEATKARDRTYEHKQVGEAISELAAVDGGFDYMESYVEGGGTTLAEFDVVAEQGTVREGAVFEHGPGTLANVARVTRRWLPPVNYARVMGENGLYQDASDPASIALYGQWWPPSIPMASGVVEAQTLTDKAVALLRPRPVEIVEFEPDPTLAPQPWDDYWLGDTVPIRCRFGSLAFEGAVRINSITVTVDEEGNEASHALTFESPTEEVS